jgi:hypothetical protein
MKHAVAGLASAIMVKLIVAGTTVSTFVFAVIFFNTAVTGTQYLAALIICVGLITYQLEGSRIKKKMGLKVLLRNGDLEDIEGTQDCLVRCHGCQNEVIQFPNALAGGAPTTASR